MTFDLLASIAGAALPDVSDLVTVLGKGFILLTASAAGAWIMRRRPAAWRHVILSTGLVGALALPLLTPLLPNVVTPWPVTVPSVLTDVVEPPVARGSGATDIGAKGHRDATAPIARPTRAVPASRATSTSDATDGESTSHLTRLVVSVWAAGVLLLALRVAIGLAAVGRIGRRARPLEEDGWQALASDVAQKLGMTHSPRLVSSDHVRTPTTWGVFRPLIVLPVDAASWPHAHCRMVLAHEMAHVRRRDTLLALVAAMACAVHWVNPLVWIIRRRMRMASEHACDDIVLAHGVRSARYAECLVAIARRAGSLGGVAFPAVEMARRSELESRVTAVLGAIPRSVSLPVAVTRVAWFFALCITSALATLRPSSAAPAAEPYVASRSHRLAPSIGDTLRSAPCVCEQDRWISHDDGAPASFEVALVRLRDGGGHVRQLAAEDLADLRDSRALEPLVTTLGDRDKHVRQSAAIALGRLGDRRAIDPLGEMLEDPEPHVRAAAVQSLGMLDAVGVRDRVQDLFETGENQHLRLAAARSLGQLGDLRGLEMLLRTLRDDPGQFTRAEAAWALGAVGATLTTGAAGFGTGGEPNGVDEAARRVETALCDALRDESGFVRYAALCSLGRVGHAGDSVTAIQRAISEERATPLIRQAATWTLGRIAERTIETRR